jgi:hypothetical protein
MSTTIVSNVTQNLPVESVVNTAIVTSKIDSNTNVVSNLYGGTQGPKGEKGDKGDKGEFGDFTFTFETVSKNIKQYPYSFNFSGSQLQSIVYDLGSGQQITKTFNYTGSLLTSISMAGDSEYLPITKNFVYSGNRLVSVNYTT